MVNSKSIPTAGILFLLLYQIVGIFAQGNQCNASLGLGDSSIPDASITSSVDGSTPSNARLNGDGAWCFTQSEVTMGFKVTLTIDLGQTVLISGLQSQGPPESMYGMDYLRYIGFKVLNSSSSEGDDWETCCDGNEVTIYADDKENQIGVVMTHPLKTLVAARRLRLEFITDVQWPGSDVKCFRFEIIGCPPNVQPTTGLSLEAVPSGFVVATWDSPTLMIPGDTDGELESVSLDATSYLAQMTRTGGGEEDLLTEMEVFARRFTVPSPLWGASYTIELLCGHQGLNLSCGSDTIQAQVQGCDPNQSTCLIQDQVIFRRPLWLQAAVVDEEKVELTWSSDSTGWITSVVLLQVTDNDGLTVDQQTLDNTEVSVIVTGVTGGNNYSVSFSPSSGDEDLATFSFHLHILAWEGVQTSTKEIGYGAFVTDVGLSVNILWNGTLRVTWTPALVLGVSWKESTTAEPITEAMNGVTDATSGITDITNDITEEAVDIIDDDWGFDNSSYDFGNDTYDTNDTNILSGNSSDVDLNSGDNSTESLAIDNTEELIASPSPTPIENSDATAFMYTIFLVADGEDRSENVTNIMDDMISVDLSFLSFEKQYAISLICHFGDVSVLCGNADAYTALPLHWTVVDDEIVIHAPAQGLGSWTAQEDQCRSGSGTLVTLSNVIEDTRLKDALIKNSARPSLDTYWIGLNMCPNNVLGSLWSDGSRWQHSRLPSVDSMLSSATCCIKAVWSQVQRQFTWLGEACEALLPAVCEYHPEGMVGEATSIVRGPANKTEASVTWTYEPKYWNASNIIIRYCPARNLMNINTDTPVDEDLGNCTSTFVDGDTSEFIQMDLIPFMEYNVSVSATISVINFTGDANEAVVRTHPETPIIVRTLPSGLLHIMWAQKVAEFEEDDNVVLQVTNSTHPNAPITSRTINAIGVTINDVTLGASYTVNLKERGGKRRDETTTVQAYPACPCDGCQIEGFCFIAQSKQSDGFSAARQCIDEDTKLVTIEDSTQVDLLLSWAEELRDDLWVDADSKRIAATDPNARDTAALLTEDAEILDDEEVTEDRSSKICLMVSRTQKAVVVEACSIMHRPACRHKAPISPAFPPVDQIRSEIGGNFISLDWDWSWGWKATYMIYYQRTREKRYKRALREESFVNPPVVISGLQLDTSYTIELVADLGGGFLSSSNEFELTTSNDTTAAVSDQLTVSSVALTQFRIMQLVCSSILVAACITTMLLFFATGMFYQDCVAQLAFQGTLMAAFLNLMLAHPNPVQPENEPGCIVLAVVLHFLFLCAFMFLMLESLTYAHLLVIQVKSPFQKSNWLMMAFGLSVPLVIVGVCAGFTYNEYADFSKSNCWLNCSGGAIWGATIPIFVLVFSSIILLICTICNKETPPELIEINLRSRQGDSHKLRWVIMALVLELSIVWSTGVSAYHTQDEPTRTAFCVFTLILAITIAGARTSLDDTFRSKMHRLCCGTELTYKRSELITLSGKSRVAPSPVNHLPSAASARFITPVGSKPIVTNTPNSPDQDSIDQDSSPDERSIPSANSVRVTNFVIKSNSVSPSSIFSKNSVGKTFVKSDRSQKSDEFSKNDEKNDVDDESCETRDSGVKSPGNLSMRSVSPQKVNPRTISRLSHASRTISRQSLLGNRTKSPEEVGTIPMNVNAIMSPRLDSSKATDSKPLIGNQNRTATPEDR